MTTLSKLNWNAGFYCFLIISVGENLLQVKQIIYLIFFSHPHFNNVQDFQYRHAAPNQKYKQN